MTAARYPAKGKSLQTEQEMKTQEKPLRLIDIWEVIKKLGVSHSTMERMRLDLPPGSSLDLM